MELNKFFETVFNEARATEDFKGWWLKQFKPDGMFFDKKVVANVTFLPANELYKDHAKTFSSVLYDPEERKLPGNVAAFKALDTLKMSLKTNLENELNNEDSTELDNDDFDEDKEPTLGYKLDQDFNGPRNSKIEVILNETGSTVEGIILRTFKTDIQKDKRDRPWIFDTADGKIESYSNYNGKSNISPYMDDIKIPLDKRGFYSDIVKGKLLISFSESEPEAPITEDPAYHEEEAEKVED